MPPPHSGNTHAPLDFYLCEDFCAYKAFPNPVEVVRTSQNVLTYQKCLHVATKKHILELKTQQVQEHTRIAPVWIGL